MSDQVKVRCINGHEKEVEHEVIYVHERIKEPIWCGNCGMPMKPVNKPEEKPK